MGISAQADLFGASEPALPAGFRYQPDVVPEDVQSDPLRELPQLPLKPFDFQGFEGKRRVIFYGWKCDYDAELVRRIDDIPPFLLPVRSFAATFAGIEPKPLEGAAHRICARRANRLA